MSDDVPTDAPTGPTGHDGWSVEITDGIGRVHLDRPAKHNAVSLAMWRSLPDVLARLDADPGVRVVVIRGTGKNFCAGADIGDLLAGPDPADPMAELRAANLAAHSAILGVSKPTVAVVTGHCIGGGLEIAAACDLRFADTTAMFGVTPARLGLVYAPSSIARLVALIGPGAAAYLLYSASVVGVEEAHRVRLVDVLVAPEELDDRVEAFLAGLATRSQLTIASAKESIRTLAGGGDPEPLAARRYLETIRVGEFPEGVAAFLERRTPEFPWTW